VQELDLLGGELLEVAPPVACLFAQELELGHGKPAHLVGWEPGGDRCLD
jgi:hypothetical protein